MVRAATASDQARARRPALGEHTDAVLGPLDYSAEPIATLRRAGVV